MLVLALLLNLVSPTLTVSPRFSPEPVTLTLTVGSLPASGSICAVIEGDFYATASCRDLSAKSRELFFFKNVPADVYFARASVCASPTNCKVSPIVEVVVTSTGER